MSPTKKIKPATLKKPGRPPKKKRFVGKQALWLKFYTDQSNQLTFMNNTQSAIAAGYSKKTAEQIGYQNFRKLQPVINEWLDNVGLSQEALKTKLLSLLQAKETKFFQKDGIVTDQRDVDAIETQRRALDMAIKVKGLYAPTDVNVTGLEGLADRIKNARDAKK